MSIEINLNKNTSRCVSRRFTHFLIAPNLIYVFHQYCMILQEEALILFILFSQSVFRAVLINCMKDNG